ncbi:hypothetical protein [Stenotrophomonas phage IME-SM1]|uniref:Uncharacterized protein n=1 Tax=Stenotrophomonas phage IME-SM1 TaxID=1654717 RepID=A0A0H4IP45_9CAUD|nr:hypothetical protein KMC40_gp011 [Stenotrophomonas phage IME-SM1]AKO61747.1 hypothetical protein [Stenotrophomonas phage IME-SM1]
MVSLIYTLASTYKPKKKRKPKGEVFQKYKPDKSFKPLTTTPSRPIRQSDQYKSAAMPAAKPVLPVRYEGEMAEREAAAQREIERKRRWSLRCTTRAATNMWVMFRPKS